MEIKIKRDPTETIATTDTPTRINRDTTSYKQWETETERKRETETELETEAMKALNKTIPNDKQEIGIQTEAEMSLTANT